MGTAHFYFDLITATHASGWIFEEDEPITAVEAWENDTRISTTGVDIDRGDVAAAHGARHVRSGFQLNYRPKNGRSKIAFRPTTPSGKVHDLTECVLSLPDPKKIAESLAQPFHHPTPFPPAVAKILRGVDSAFDKPLEDTDHDAAVDLIRSLILPEFAKSVPDVMHYVRFLRDSWTHMVSVDRYFPEINEYAEQGAHDYHCKTNSPDQMLSIVNQLYVSKAHGLAGAFAEFGCFKGFSTSMLSTPCNRLGIPMLVFDSFEGLPPSDDPTYNTGEFRGGLEEVKGNVNTFGDISNITFHKGFFSDTLAKVEVPLLMQLWMDVDLYTSARDLTPVFNQLDPRATIFSHECDASMFEGGFVIEDMPRSPGNVVPAITDKLKELGSPKVSGRFIAGNTGSLWRPTQGIPVLDPKALMRLIRMIA
jgi:hypothetical protein